MSNWRLCGLKCENRGWGNEFGRRNPLFFALLLAGLFLSLSGCGSRDTSTEDVALQLNRGLDTEPETLDPHKYSSTQSADVLRDLGVGLVRMGPDNEIVPGVATSWVVSEDRLTYTFFLRDDALWSNGERVTAGDFVFAWRRLVDPVTASPNALFLDAIENVGDVVAGREKPASIGVRAASEESLVVSLERPTPYFLQLLAAPAALPLSESFLSQEERAPFLPGTYLSNGAYTLTSWTPGASIALTRNRHYADRASVYFERVVYQFLDDDRQTTLFRAGQLDITSSVASPMIELLREERPTELRISQFLGTYYYGFNLSDPLFRDNRNLRQALSMAIDREVIVNKITRRGEEPAYGWVPNDMPGYRATRLGFSELHERNERIGPESFSSTPVLMYRNLFAYSITLLNCMRALLSRFNQCGRESWALT